MKIKISPISIIKVNRNDELIQKALKNAKIIAQHRVDDIKRKGEKASLSTVIKQFERGFISEAMIFHYLKSVGLNPTEPDFQLREGAKRKGYNADLTLEGYKISIKSSYLKGFLEYSSNFDNADIKKEKPDNELFIQLGLEDYSSEIISGQVLIVSFLNIIKHNHLQLPKSPRLRNFKSSIYLKKFKRTEKDISNEERSSYRKEIESLLGVDLKGIFSIGI
jgi:hypothetical protein